MYQVFMTIQYAGIAILTLEIIFILFQNTSRIQRDMMFLLFSLLVVFVAYTMELQSQSLPELMSAVKFGYLGKPFVMLSMFCLILDYCRIRLSRWLSLVLFLIESFLTLTVFTAEKHMLFYSSITFVEDGLFPHADFGHGPLYLFYSAHTLCYCIAMFALCIVQARRLASMREKRQLQLFFVMVLVPLLSFGLFLTDILQGYDCTLPAYLFSTIGFSVSFFRLNLLDAVTLAKEEAVDYIHGGLMVYDARGRLIYHNELADRLNLGERAAKLAENREMYEFEDRVYFVENREIYRDDIKYGHMYFIQDVTEHCQYENSLREETRRADEASAAKTRFLFSMSHDMRTPMNAILGMTKIASAHLDNSEKVAECLKKIDISGHHLLGLINEILDMSKIESGSLTLICDSFDLEQLFDEVITITRPLTDDRKQCFLTTSDLKHTSVVGDKTRLSQALMNILGNAVKYTDQGGKIEFSAVEAAAADEETANPVYVFTVRDNGIGMSEEYLPRLFDPFTRADDESVAKIQGSGLGMAITKQIIELMNGEISVTSTLGEGSCFVIRVPLQLQSGEVSAPEKEVTIEDFSDLDLSSKRVLLVEDNHFNAEIAKEVLDMTNLIVDHVWNGKEAVEQISSCPDGHYDLVFMDVQMPVMNGYEATRAIRAIGSPYTDALPIIAMTANAFEEDIQNARDAGMNEHLSKPLDLTKLMNVIQKFLDV